MNKNFLLACFLLISTSLMPQQFKNDSIKDFIDKSIELIRSNSIHTENLDLIKSELYNRSKDVQSLDQVAPFYKEVFKDLNDHHGSLKYKGKTYGWDKALAASNPYLKNKIKSEDKVVSTVIDKRFAYIRIPGNNDFAFKKVDSIANDIVSHINNINSNKIKGWIIDLRLNTGGNMYPILLGLKEFIGNDIAFGGFRNPQNQSTGNWEIKAGKMIIDGVELERKLVLKRPIGNLPVVVLTSCYTASAGEMTAISFIGRDKTFIAGEATANYTTAVQGFKINKFAGINLSTDYVVDRNQKVYKSNITPDIEVMGGDNLDNLYKDRKIIKAIQLLKK